MNKNNDEAARKAAKFIPAFFAGLSGLALSYRHPKWREVNLAATLPGWSRAEPAEEWLSKAREEQTDALQRRFEEFLRATRLPGSAELSPTQRRKLFDEFVSWTRKSVSDTGQPARR